MRVFRSSPFMVKGQKIVLPANKQYVFVNKAATRLDTVVTVTKNSLGFRGAEPPAHFQDCFSIIVVGGSSAASENITDGKTWVDLLAKKFSTDNGHVWINNAGFAGHSTIAHLLLVEDYIVKLKPKMIVIFAGTNDIEAEGHRNFDEGIVQGKLQFNTFIDFLRSVNRNFETLNLAVNLFQKYRGVKRDFSYGELDLRKVPQLVLDPEKKEAKLNKYERESLTNFKGRIQRLVEVCRQNGIRPVFVTVPTLFRDGVDDVTGVNLSTLQVTPDTNGGLMAALLALYNQQILALREQGVDVIDLAARFPASSRYFSDFYHFTNEGSAEVANILYPPLRALEQSMAGVQ